jgi:hypothetical protein
LFFCGRDLSMIREIRHVIKMMTGSLAASPAGRVSLPLSLFLASLPLRFVGAAFNCIITRVALSTGERPKLNY